MTLRYFASTTIKDKPGFGEKVVGFLALVTMIIMEAQGLLTARTHSIIDGGCSAISKDNSLFGEVRTWLNNIRQKALSEVRESGPGKSIFANPHLS